MSVQCAHTQMSNSELNIKLCCKCQMDKDEVVLIDLFFSFLFQFFFYVRIDIQNEHLQKFCLKKFPKCSNSATKSKNLIQFIASVMCLLTGHPQNVPTR